MSATETAVSAEGKARARPIWASYAEAIPRYLIESVPAVTAQTLAVCRIVFGLSILFFWLTYTPQSLGTLARSGPAFGFTKFVDQTGLLTLISASPQAQTFLYWSIAVLLMAFVAGLLTRILYPVLVALIWVAAFLQNHGHFITPLLTAMTATIFAPWSERWSLDSLLFRDKPRTQVATRYFGYAIWLLGLSIGLTYTAAGLSKIILTYGGWLWETGARNGLIQDMRYAATDWGTFINNSFILSLGASILSAVGQAIYVWASFTRSPTIKYGIGIFVAAPFLIGLILFMGLFWWPWAILVIILYLPWPTIDRMVARGRADVIPFGGTPQLDRQRNWFLSVTTFMIAVHAMAVITRTEYEPLYSNYPMYADRMLAGSPAEKEFWNRFKTYDRNYKYKIQVVGQNADTNAATVRDLSAYYDIAYFFRRYSLARLDVAGFKPSVMLEATSKNEILNKSECSELKKLASAYALSGSQAVAVRYGKRHFDLVDGKIVWQPIKSWTEIDLIAPNCPYRQVADDSEAASTSKQ